MAGAETRTVALATTPVAREAAEAAGRQLVAQPDAAGGVVRVPRNGGVSVQDLAAATRASGREVALYRDLASGDRFMAIGDRASVSVPENSRIIAHVQPGAGPAAVRASVADEVALARAGQRSSVIIDEAGTTATRFRPTDEAAALARSERVGGPLELNAPKKPSLRDEYMGGTPDKFSRTGLEVLERMRAEGKIEGVGDLTRGNPNQLKLKNADGTTTLIDHTVDMAHRTDAVSWRNTIGRTTGAKSDEVRQFMLDPDNYELQPRSINRSEGAKLGETYQPPVTPVFSEPK